jgi:hypothetical protein
MRKGQAMKTNEEKIKLLEREIKKLKKVIETQRQFIDVLKTLPGNKGVKLKPEKRGKKKNGVSKRAQGESGAVVTDGATREPKVNSASVGDNSQSVTLVAETWSAEK